MSKLLFIALGFMLAACSPQSFAILVDTKIPPENGIDISGKSVCIVYAQNGSSRDSLFSSNFCDGLAQGIESNFFNGKRAIEVFSLEDFAVQNSEVQDHMVDLVLQTNSDVVMMLDSPAFTETDEGAIKCQYTLYAYDSMGKADSVAVLTKSEKISSFTDNIDMFGSDAQYMGYTASSQFDLEWEERQYSFIYFEMLDNRWINAMYAVYSQEWKQAIDYWIPIAEDVDRSDQQVSCAAYNIAAACHLLGDNELAAEWLERSDKLYPVSLSPGLKKRIKAAK